MLLFSRLWYEKKTTAGGFQSEIHMMSDMSAAAFCNLQFNFASPQLCVDYSVPD